MQNNTLMLNNIILEEIIKAKLLDTPSKPANISKVNEQKFNSLCANISLLKQSLLKEQTDNK
jgi:hypothetical protein